MIFTRLQTLISNLVFNYNAYWIYWTSIFKIPNFYLLTTIVLFLTIDRCLVLNLALNYQQRYRRINLYIALFVVPLIWIFNNALHLLDYPQQADTSMLILNMLKKVEPTFISTHSLPHPCFITGNGL